MAPALHERPAVAQYQKYPMANPQQAAPPARATAAVYITLRDLIDQPEPSRTANLYAVVADTSAPAKTRGTDWKVKTGG